MVYRELDEVAQKRLALRAKLEHLAQGGVHRRQQADRPATAPLSATDDRWMRNLPFRVVEDAENALAVTPPTRDVDIWVNAEPISADDLELVRRAVWSVHPLFETSYSNLEIRIELPSSKLLDVRSWIRSVIELVLP